MSAPGSGPDSDERRASTVVLGARRRLEQAHDLWHAAVAAYREADVASGTPDTAFVAKLRAEERYDSLEALVKQMHVDAADARRVLAGVQPPTG